MKRKRLGREGYRDSKGEFIPVPQCTGRRRPKPKPKKRTQKPKKPRVVSKSARTKKAAPMPVDAWLRSSPFTTEQTDKYNRYTHFEVDFNKEFDTAIKRIKKDVADKLKKYPTNQADIDIAESQINKYRRKLYEYYLTKFDLQSYYPPVSVVGPAKYPYRKKSKAAARENKMIRVWEKAVAEFDREIHRITKGRTAKATTFQWAELALSMDRLSFGKSYAKDQIKKAQFPNAEAFASTYRKRGRELHKDLVRNAVDRGTPIEYFALKDYPDLLERAQVLHAPPPKTRPSDAKKATQARGKLPVTLTKDERDLLRLIGKEKMQLDDLNEILDREAGFTRSAVSATLLNLELKNMIHQSAGKMFEATKPPKMSPAPISAFKFRIEPKESAILKRIESGQTVGKDEVKFSYLLQHAHTYYEPESIREKLIVDKEHRAQTDHISWAGNKLSKADDKRYGKIILEMVNQPKAVDIVTIEGILKPYISPEQIWGLVGRLYMAGEIVEVGKYQYKIAPGGYTLMQIKEIQKSYIPPFLGRNPYFKKGYFRPSAKQRKAGKRLIYLYRKGAGLPLVMLPRKDREYWKERSGSKFGLDVFATFAYNAEHAKEQVQYGEVAPYHEREGREAERQPHAPLTPEQLTFLGLQGDISTCAYWIPTEDEDYICGKYIQTCESQAEGACEPPPPNRYKVCAITKKVKSDPKGIYKGKLIKRCKTYRARCLPESQCIEDKLFPKPEVFKLDKVEIQDIAASMAKEFNLLQKAEGPALAREILDRGGLKAYRGETQTEEWAEVPFHLKRKSGKPLDEMASEMGFDSDTALRKAIEKEYPTGKKIRRKTWKDYESEAKEILIEQEQSYEYDYQEEPVPF